MHAATLSRLALPGHRIAAPLLAAFLLLMPTAKLSASMPTTAPSSTTPAVTSDTADGTNMALRREILAMDARLSEAYAECRSQRLRALFARDAELVFADRGITRGVTAHLDALRREGCRLHRESPPASQRIYPLPGAAGALDGAIQIGTQVFCASATPPCHGLGTDFVAVWRRTDGGWRIKRLIRYGYVTTP